MFFYPKMLPSWKDFEQRGAVSVETN
uniref:Uncharacterized protein n=1 Tax=Vitis vinifera TaxID=29760 RepID=F6HZR5_VITVI